MVKKFQWKLWNMKNGHSEDDIFHTLSGTENFKSNFYYKSVTLKLIEVKRKVPKSCGYLSHPLDAYDKASLGQSPWTNRNCCRNMSEKLQQEFLKSLKGRSWKLPCASMTSNAMFTSIILYIFMK